MAVSVSDTKRRAHESVMFSCRDAESWRNHPTRAAADRTDRRLPRGQDKRGRERSPAGRFRLLFEYGVATKA